MTTNSRNPSSRPRARIASAAVVAALALVLPSTAHAGAAQGEANFTKHCSACHTVGGGKRVGPDLKGVTERRKRDWLLKWIPASQSLVKANDPTATELMREYNNVPMPDFPLSAAEVGDLIDYMAGAGAAAAPAGPPRVYTPSEAEDGRRYFDGSLPFSGGGPACSSCHHVTHDAVIGGGVLAKELTTAYGRLGDAGVRAILGSPPFPVMEQAFKSRTLTEAEQTALTAYLATLKGGNDAYEQPRQDAIKLLAGGVGGLALWLGLYGVIWRRRKPGPVNEAVFDRQTKSE